MMFFVFFQPTSNQFYARFGFAIAKTLGIFLMHDGRQEFSIAVPSRFVIAINHFGTEIPDS